MREAVIVGVADAPLANGKVVQPMSVMGLQASVALAALNEAVWRSTSTDFWVGFKIWGAIPLTLVFAILNVPMLMRHGLQAQDASKTVPPQE